MLSSKKCRLRYSPAICSIQTPGGDGSFQTFSSAPSHPHRQLCLSTSVAESHNHVPDVYFARCRGLLLLPHDRSHNRRASVPTTFYIASEIVLSEPAQFLRRGAGIDRGPIPEFGMRVAASGALRVHSFRSDSVRLCLKLFCASGLFPATE